jgi:hypothetical protein
MSTHGPTGASRVEATKPLETRREARMVESFAEYLANDAQSDHHRALEALALIVRQRPWTVSASVLRRTAGKPLRARPHRRQ